MSTGARYASTLVDLEAVHYRVVIGLIWLELRTRKARLIGRIRKVLRLHGEPRMNGVPPAILSGNRSVEEVAGVELQPGLGGQHFENPPAVRLIRGGI